MILKIETNNTTRKHKKFDDYHYFDVSLGKLVQIDNYDILIIKKSVSSMIGWSHAER